MTARVRVAVLMLVLISSPAIAQGDPDLLGPALDKLQLGDLSGALLVRRIEKAEEKTDGEGLAALTA